MRTTFGLVIVALAATFGAAGPVRVPVLDQIALPHNYYYRELYLPQLTSGPSSVSWSADGGSLVYSMQGSLWRQRTDGTVAEQLTDGRGDYQPHCSPDGRSVVFVRYDGRALELMLLDLASREVRPLTTGGAVNVEPRWSPDGSRLAFVSTAGSGHFLLHVADFRNGRLGTPAPIVPGRRSAIQRYYYSPFDHAINPTWTRDGRELLFVSNREIAHGTGDIVRMAATGGATPQLVHHEETSWHARPDVSPDGRRIVYSSYLGGQWQQLWLMALDGDYAFPLTYGDYDNTNPMWSPDGRSIAFVSNRTGNTSLWVIDATSGAQRRIEAAERRYLRPRRELVLRVVDEGGRSIPARISVSDSQQRSYAPDTAWIHADDLIVHETQAIETRYFHGDGESRIAVPYDRLTITASHGPAYEIAHIEDDARQADWPGTRTVTLRRLAMPDGWGSWWSGDLHVHMNYGGLYRNTPERLSAQGQAEDLNLITNLVVNKEQRFPDIASFRTDPDPASTDRLLILHGQEFHTSYWGHLSILNLAEHLLLPGYAAYPFTAAASPYPHNAAVADMAHAQRGLVGYAHPFDEDVDPGQSAPLTNELPVDAALAKIDYYEAVGFSDHKSTNAVWYRLLQCGVNLPAGAGTDAMANYASLRGPVGLNRVYVPAAGALTREAFFAAVKQGRGVATNGPLLQLKVGESGPGDTLRLTAAGRLQYRAMLRANVPIDHLELIWNGQVAASVPIGADKRTADVSGELAVAHSGWLLLRAWNDAPHPDVLDIYPYATTSPIYVNVGGARRRSPEAGAYFLRWLDRIESATAGNSSYRTDAERNAVLDDVRKARVFYEDCRQETATPVHDVNVAVPMRDGTQLRADVFRPSGVGSFPTLVYRTPYGKDAALTEYTTFARAVERGYAVVVQDVRGRYHSGGQFRPYENEGRDGYDTIEWAARQPWSNGRVGTFGLSYPGAVQWLAAVEGPPHLLAMVPAMTFSTPQNFFYSGGVWDLSWISWIWESIAADARAKRGLPDAPPWKDVKTRMLATLPIDGVAELRDVAPYYSEWVHHPPDDPFWNFAELRNKYRGTKAAVLNLSGWNDDNYGPEGAITNFLGLEASRRGQPLDAALLLGPWVHGVNATARTRFGDRDFGPAAAIAYDDVVLAWMDRYLRGDRGAAALSGVRYFVMGANVWKTSDTWPPRGHEAVFYLSSSAAPPSRGTLTPTAPSTAGAPSTFVSNPDDPVVNAYESAGVHDYRALAERADVLTFDSPPLTNEMEVTGPIRARVFLSCDCRDTDLWVRLLDVAPDGRAYNLMSPGLDVVRASYRDVAKGRQLLSPGRVYELALDRLVTSNVFQSGHRIRVQISTTFFPNFSRNLHTGELETASARTRKATISIYHDRDHPSQVSLHAVDR